jgi:aspartate aminotransferase
MTAKEESLDSLRTQVAATTVEIIRSIGIRNDLAREIGRLKEEKAIPGQDERVEDALVRTVLDECNRTGVSHEAGLKVLNVLLGESKRVQGLEPATGSRSPMESFAKALAMERSGHKVIRLDIGEPDFKPPRAVIEACTEALSSSKTRYTPSRGIPELVEALRVYLAKERGFDAKEDEVLVTTGGRFAVYASIATAVKEGESAIVIDPNWPAYKQALQFIGAKAQVVHTTLEDAWDPSPDAIRRAVRPNTKALIISYPNNPTGKVIGKGLFEEIIAIANDNGLTVISDEAYSGYSSPQSLSVLGSLARSFVMTGTFSKTWSMTGFRVGYAVSSKKSIDRMLQMVSLMLTSVPEFVQYGAIRALESDREAAENSATIKQRIDVASGELDKDHSLEYYKPDGAMYIFPRSKARGFSSQKFADELLQKERVSVIPGTAFGAYPEFFRISLGQPAETLTEGIRRMRGFPR